MYSDSFVCICSGVEIWYSFYQLILSILKSITFYAKMYAATLEQKVQEALCCVEKYTILDVQFIVIAYY